RPARRARRARVCRSRPRQGRCDLCPRAGAGRRAVPGADGTEPGGRVLLALNGRRPRNLERALWGPFVFGPLRCSVVTGDVYPPGRARMEDEMHVDGQCHCGAIAFTAEIDPDTTRICHCTDCQKLTGTAFRVTITGNERDLHMLRGTPRI